MWMEVFSVRYGIIHINYFEMTAVKQSSIDIVCFGMELELKEYSISVIENIWLSSYSLGIIEIWLHSRSLSLHAAYGAGPGLAVLSASLEHILHMVFAPNQPCMLDLEPVWMGLMDWLCSLKPVRGVYVEHVAHVDTAYWLCHVMPVCGPNLSCALAPYPSSCLRGWMNLVPLLYTIIIIATRDFSHCFCFI